MRFLFRLLYKKPFVFGYGQIQRKYGNALHNLRSKLFAWALCYEIGYSIVTSLAKWASLIEPNAAITE